MCEKKCGGIRPSQEICTPCMLHVGGDAVMYHFFCVFPVPCLFSTPTMAPPKAWQLATCAIALASNFASPNTVDAFVPAASSPFSSSKKTVVYLEHRLKLNPVAYRQSFAASGTAAPLAMVLPEAAAAAVGVGEAGWASTVLSTSVAGGESSVEISSRAAAAMMMLLAEGGGVMEGMDMGKLGLFTFGGIGLVAAVFKTAVYWRMQYVVSCVCGYVCVCVLLLRVCVWCVVVVGCCGLVHF